MWDYEKVIMNALTGGAYSTSKAADAITTAGKTAAEDIEEAGKSIKSASDLYKEGRQTAAQAANDKAGIAKKQAKAAAMQSSNSRLMGALQGAEAANKAAQEGFDTQSAQSAALAQQQNLQQYNNRLAQAQQKYNTTTTAAELEATAGKQQADAWLTGAKNIGNMAAALL